MWQRFTESARRMVFFAQEEAGLLGENSVSSEHLLLGLTRDSRSVAARILDRLGVPLARIRAEIERQVVKNEGRLTQDMQLTPRAKRIVDLASDEAQQLNNNYIGTEHLLLGIIREGEGLAGRILSKLGVDLERARTVVIELQDAEPGSPKPPAADASHLGLRRLPVVGARGLLRDNGTEGDPAASEASPRSVVEVAMNPQAFVELLAAFAAKDRHGYRDLHQTGVFFLVPAGTPALRLEFLLRRDSSNDVRTAAAVRDASADGFLVRVLGTGEHAGRAGWVVRRAFHADESAEAGDVPPFPPPV